MNEAIHVVPSLRVVVEVEKQDLIKEFLTINAEPENAVMTEEESIPVKTKIEWVFPIEQIKCVTVAEHTPNFHAPKLNDNAMVVLDCGGKGLYKFEVTAAALYEYQQTGWGKYHGFPFRQDKKLKAKSYSVQFN